MYSIEMPASGGAEINNDTEGVGWFTCEVVGALPFRGPTIGFRRAALNDMFIEGGTTSTNLEDFFDGTGYAGGTAKLTVDLNKVFGTVLTEGGAGRLAAALIKLLDVVTPVLTCESVNQAQDNATTAEIKTALETGLTLATLSITGQLDAGNLLVDGTTVLTGATTLSGDVTIAEEVALSKTLGITGAVTLTAGINAGAISGTLANDLITAASLKADAATKIIDDFETQSAADPTGFQVNVMEINGTAQTAGADLGGAHGIVSIQDDIDTLLTRIVGTLLAGNHPVSDAAGVAAALHVITDGLIAALNDLSVADLNAATPAVTVSDKTGFSLSAAGIDAIANEEYDNDGVAISLREAIRILLAGMSARSTGGGTATISFRDLLNTKNRIRATVDANGNRTAIITRDGT
jgi:hypothetical protein